jgi:short-subunit dehydrogenase
MHDALSAGSTALITGSSSGIGAAFARELPNETHLILTARNAARLEALSAAVAQPGRHIEVVAADLATSKGREAVVDAALQSEIDLLVCCAGSGSVGNFHETALSAQREALELSVIATTELLHALIEPMIAAAMRKSRRGGIIVVSSRAAFGPLPGLASYAAGKAFQLRLVESIAMELRDQPLDVLAVCPTYTETDFFARAGMPPPPWWVSPESVAHESLEALGRRSIHVCYGPDEQRHPPLYHRVLRRIWRTAKRFIPRR